jgi:hypothetical protein
MLLLPPNLTISPARQDSHATVDRGTCASSDAGLTLDTLGCAAGDVFHDVAVAVAVVIDCSMGSGTAEEVPSSRSEDQMMTILVIIRYNVKRDRFVRTLLLKLEHT